MRCSADLHSDYAAGAIENCSSAARQSNRMLFSWARRWRGAIGAVFADPPTLFGQNKYQNSENKSHQQANGDHQQAVKAAEQAWGKAPRNADIGCGPRSAP